MARHERRRAGSRGGTDVVSGGSLVPRLASEESRLQQLLSDAEAEAGRRVDQARAEADRRLQEALSELNREIAALRERRTAEIREELDHHGHSQEERIALLDERARSRVPQAVELIVETVLGGQDGPA